MLMGIEELIHDKREEILRIAAKQGASNVRIFGSVARGEARPDSDVDFLVDGLENAPWGGGGLLVELEKLLGRKVDVVSPEDLHWYIRERVLREAKHL